jgi:transcriptional regulator with XRE-family HTH domain
MMRRLTKSKKGQTMQRQPHALLDALMLIYGIQTDNSLADKLAISTGSVSRIRNGTQNISAALILAIYERSGMSIDNIKDLIKEDHERRLRRAKERQETSHDQ